MAAAGAITAVAGLVIVGAVTGSGPSGPAAAGPAVHTGGVPAPAGFGFTNQQPLGPPGMAEKTTVTGAQAKVGYPVPVPSTAAASRANLTQVWVDPHGSRQAALVFDNGKVEILTQPYTHQNALSYFHAFVAQKKKNNAPNATIGQVNGRPALMTGRGAVNFWRNGILISIYSNTSAYGTDTLLAIASSMR